MQGDSYSSEQATVCLYLVDLICGGVLSNSHSERGFVGHGYSQLHVWHAIIVLGREKERWRHPVSDRQTTAQRTRGTFSVPLPHLTQTGTLAWCHFLQLPAQSTLQMRSSSYMGNVKQQRLYNGVNSYFGGDRICPGSFFPTTLFPRQNK